MSNINPISAKIFCVGGGTDERYTLLCIFSFLINSQDISGRVVFQIICAMLLH